VTGKPIRLAQPNNKPSHATIEALPYEGHGRESSKSGEVYNSVLANLCGCEWCQGNVKVVGLGDLPA